MSFSEIELDLKSKGYKKSKLRIAILEILNTSAQPQSALEILTKASIKFKEIESQSRYSNLNKTSIYRQLEILEKENIIIEIDLSEGKKRYEIKPKNSHHHHLICIKCTKIECYSIHEDLLEIETEINTKMGFKVEKHHLEFFGKCKNCQSKI